MSIPIQEAFYRSPLRRMERMVAGRSSAHEEISRREMGARLSSVRRRFGASPMEFCSVFGLSSTADLDGYEAGAVPVPPDFLAQLTARTHINYEYLVAISEEMFLPRTLSCAAVILRLEDGYVPHLFVWDAGLRFQLVLEKPLCPSERISAILPVNCIASLESGLDKDMECISHLCEMLARTQRVPCDMVWHFGDHNVVAQYLHHGIAPGAPCAMPEPRRVEAHRRLWSYFLRHIGPAQMRSLLSRPQTC